MDKVKIWLKAMRAPFFQVTVIAGVVGTAVAWRDGFFHGGLFLLVCLGIAAINAGTNLANDYFDHKSGADDRNVNVTPFSGGSRIIQEKALLPRQMLAGAGVAFFVAGLIGIYLTVSRGLPVLYFAVAGIVIGYFYTASPFKLGYRGWGELFVFLTAGPLAVMGAYYVQAQSLSWGSLWASLPIGLLTATVLYINEFPDYEPDKAAGKGHLIVRLGPQKAIKGYYLLLIAIYSVLLVGVFLDYVPLVGLVCLLTLPLAWKAIRVAKKYYNQPLKLVPAMGATIQLTLLFGLLLAASYGVDKFLG